MIIGVDFDGTIAKSVEFPRIGEEVPYAIETLHRLVQQGDRIILWTMRSGEALDDALDFLEDRGVELYGVNHNPEQDEWTDSPKAHCNVYIDDKGFGCPVIFEDGEPYVDWYEVQKELVIR